jgi:hypothetical protein
MATGAIATLATWALWKDTPVRLLLPVRGRAPRRLPATWLMAAHMVTGLKRTP